MCTLAKSALCYHALSLLLLFLGFTLSLFAGLALLVGLALVVWVGFVLVVVGVIVALVVLSTTSTLLCLLFGLALTRQLFLNSLIDGFRLFTGGDTGLLVSRVGHN